MERAVLRHPAALGSDPLRGQTCPLFPAVTGALDRRARGPAAITSTGDKGTWSCIEVLAHKRRRKEFLME